jgi:hypothetical protein
MPVRYYMDSGVPHTTSTYVNLMRTLQASDIVYLEATARTIGLGSVELTVLPPPPPGDLNNTSVGIVVRYGEFRALLTGDSEIGELNYFLERGVPDVTVLKAAHHGSRDGVSPAWLSATRPEVVVISCGLDNPYGHPHPWALRYYQTVAEHVYRTDLDGEVRVLGRRDGQYEVVSNSGSAAIEVGGWTLCDAAGACFTFPPGASIEGGGKVVVFTGAGRNDGITFYMNRGRAVWNNRGDVATLRDAARRVMAVYVY